ncbi:glycosyltransferase family A protein [Caryophanon tenue]|uniref:Glycosyltransferase 2-like domain-containing protein n=1 Tax=Caryophanon tenue TaxID=33978 RepID=A0A1C0Y806_9BACL|nr:glycosyltransferase family A protein [Caryophanon tenue]OCS83280.1 hypothetical protein A6M13_04455 [Caryophanon tenue]
MFLTIAIPTYNRKHTLGRCLKSLENQKNKNFEVVIVDDGSKDGTQKYIEDYMNESELLIRFFLKENGGKYTAINLALEKAEGEYFLILDSDDWMADDAVDILYNMSAEIKDSSTSGIIGKCLNSRTNEVIGEKFSGRNISYLDLHFPRRKNRKNYGDCCEMNKTEVLRNFKFPENKEVKFIPEAYIFDQVGLNHQLICTNKVLKYVEYQSEDGITLNENFKSNNIEGYLINYHLRLEKIVPNLKHSKFFYQIVAWWRYWDAYQKVNKDKYEFSEISSVGRVVKLAMPFINLYYEKKYTELFRKGR